MTNNTNMSSRKPRRWLRWIGFVFGGFIVLFVVAYLSGRADGF
jgi:hypothetical protein